MSFEHKKNSKIIVALDYDNKRDAILLAKKLDPSLCNLKVGLQLFVSCGPIIIQDLHTLGYKVFLDLKFHDITNTVVKSCLAASQLGVWMINIHSSGGSKTMRQVMKEVKKNKYKTLVLGVTMLTSIDENEMKEIGYINNMEQQVLNMAEMSYKSNLNGIVCSAQEAKLVKSRFPDNFLCVCPGIRGADHSKNDQKRIMTPRMAFENGADYIVVGRPITESDNPLDMLKSIKKEFNNLP
jgi:orotidine-5'-phosphate decarboxylase|tara:strand:+ start:645 stop:1361 length:717 start_codon:yes stop_codon:yes gene_type:complete